MQQQEETTVLSKFIKHPPINIDFRDLTYTVPQGRKSNKIILRSISGHFQSGQLTGILGSSGSGKSTLLNILAGYKSHNANGTILINDESRNMKTFHNISRYIMQEDLLQPMLTVDEVMLMVADLKLDKSMKLHDKQMKINETLNLLGLLNTKNTMTNQLSGGERRRLSIALELLDDPQVIFLDEPTTGLDDLSCSQCILLLKKIAKGGRTVICSIHQPSARLFSIFDSVFILSAGQCVYQGYGPDLISYLPTFINIQCPKYYNPADFFIDVCNGDYGNYEESLVLCIDNGRNYYKNHKLITIFDNDFSYNVKQSKIEYFDEYQQQFDKITKFDQFKILMKRMWTQIWRDKNYLLLKIVIHLSVGIVYGMVFIDIGWDGSKTYFNFGFYFMIVLFFMYVPMMPALLEFPTQVRHLKRELFNKWYSLSSYYWALTISHLPLQILFGCMFLSIVYVLSGQPYEWQRLLMFYFISMLTSIVSESFGILIGTNFQLINAIFLGPVFSIPFILLAVYGFGEGNVNVSAVRKFLMRFSYLRYSLEGVTVTMLQNRSQLECPEYEEFCRFVDLDQFIKLMGMEDAVILLDILALIFFILLFRLLSYYLLYQRLSPNKIFIRLRYFGKFLRSKFQH